MELIIDSSENDIVAGALSCIVCVSACVRACARAYYIIRFFFSRLSRSWLEVGMRTALRDFLRRVYIIK